MRCADSRILPALLAALTPAQSAHFLSPIYRWWSLRRDGSLVSWQDEAQPRPIPAEFDKFPLSDAAFAALVDIAEADATLANLHDVQPDLFHSGTSAECHARVARHLLVANASGIEAAGQRQHFSALALMLADDFYRASRDGQPVAAHAPGGELPVRARHAARRFLAGAIGCITVFIQLP